MHYIKLLELGRLRAGEYVQFVRCAHVTALNTAQFADSPTPQHVLSRQLAAMQEAKGRVIKYVYAYM